MAATAVKVPFADASPAEIREVLLPEDLPRFDEQYQRALQAAAETYRLDELNKTLASWRRIAWSTTAEGPEAWRALLAKADRILATGELAPGTRPWGEVKAELGLQVAYRLDIDPLADEQIRALATDVRVALDEVMTVLGLVPWNGAPINDTNPDGAVRQLVFGPGGNGLITYLILEDQRRVDVLRVQWADL